MYYIHVYEQISTNVLVYQMSSAETAVLFTSTEVIKTRRWHKCKTENFARKTRKVTKFNESVSYSFEWNSDFTGMDIHNV